MALVVLKSHRDEAIRAIEQISAWATSATDERSKIKFEQAYLKMPERENTFEEAQSNYKDALLRAKVSPEVTAEIEQQRELHDQIRDLIYDIKSDYVIMFPPPIVTKQGTESPEGSVISSASHSGGSRPFLPRINLPTFDGDKANFVNFMDLFGQMVISRDDISEIEKFQYLKMSLKGEPLNLIKHLPVSAANFKDAWQMLISGYYNPRILRAIHLHKIMDIEALSSPYGSGLKELLNTARENLSALKALEVPIEDDEVASSILETLLADKLDYETRRRWELEISSGKPPSLGKLLNFLQTEVSSRETFISDQPNKRMVQSQKSRFAGKANSNVKQPSNGGTNQRVTLLASASECPLCKNTHLLYSCKAFGNKQPKQRYEFVRQHRLCFNCLREGHGANRCSSDNKCKKCQSRHHTLLHFERQQATASSSNSQEAEGERVAAKPTVSLMARQSQHNSTVLLASALIEILDKNGQPRSVRAIFDTGSQSSYMTTECAQRLGLKSISCETTVLSLGGKPVGTASSIVNCNIRPHGLISPAYLLTAIVVKSIANETPSNRISYEYIRHVKNLRLADPDFAKPGSVDMLLSAEVFARVLRNGKRSGGPGQPTAINTAFGWVVMGEVGGFTLPANNTRTFRLTTKDELSSVMSKFWELEDVPTFEKPTSKDELKSETHYVETVKRLPFKHEPPRLGNSFSKANRVAKIQNVTAVDSWSHVVSQHNAADPGSRGIMPSEFTTCDLWFRGPSWLREPESKWPISKAITNSDRATEEQKTEQTKVCFHLKEKERFSLFDRCSNYAKMLRILAYCLRFIARTRHKLTSERQQLSADELRAARNSLIKLVQTEQFGDVFEAFSKQQPCAGHIQKLAPFLEPETGLIRVGGRLRNADLGYDQKFPILLPAKHPVVNLLIVHTHEEYNHLPPQALSSQLGRQFWILSARRTIRGVLSKCVKCFKTRPTISYPSMGNFPADRVNPAKAFIKCGVDYGGPYKISLSRRRGQGTQKAYICLFVCFTTEAVHLELASDLTSEKFLDALSRFIARRGRVEDIYSDCGTNFVGANRYLTELQQFLQSEEFNKKASDQLNIKGINWHFNPPSSPHFGGLWEAGIKSTKIVVDDLVIVTDEPLPPTHWRMGRVVELIPGQDGVARVAEVKTQRGTIMRPIVKLCILPLSE